MRLLPLLLVASAAGCVAAPDIPPEVRKQTQRVKAGGESFPVDFYFQGGDQPRPLAVVVHGFLGSKDRMAHWGVMLARRGFHVAVPTDPTRANDRRNTAAIVGLVRDGRAGGWPVAVRCDGRVALVGFSRGGYETLLAASELGEAVDAWIGLDPVDRNDKGMAAARKIRAPGLALLADPAPLNANGNARRMLADYAGPVDVERVRGAGHLDAESPGRNGAFAVFSRRVSDFLDRVLPR